MVAEAETGQGKRRGKLRRWVSAATGATLLAAAGLALAANPGGIERSRKTPAIDVEQPLASLLEGQRSTSVALGELREQLEDTRKSVDELRVELRRLRDGLQPSAHETLEEVKGMREEVRGLYVESGGLKSDLAKMGEQVGVLGSSLDGFRLSAGIVVALVVVLQLVLVALGLRAKG